MKEKENWHQRDGEQVLKEFNTDLDRGLSAAEVKRREKKYGPNALREEPARSLFSLFMGQMREVLVVILLVAATVSGILGEWADALVIMIIVIFNAVLGVVQERRAEEALRALREMAKPLAKVLREGVLSEVKAEALLPGDIIFLNAGDFVPADARLLDHVSLQVDEAVLTGESLPVEKDPATLGPGDIPVGDRKNMLFMGTTVTGGRGRALVVATGQDTQLGLIAAMLAAVPPQATPLQQQLARLGKELGMAAGLIVFLVFITGIWRGEEALAMFMTAISLAVAAVPEGLPAIVTIVLALGMTRMSQQRVIIRKLPAVETLGTTTIICSDKTGTLTKNEMTVKRIFLAEDDFRLSGSGYDPRGEFWDGQGRKVEPREGDALSLLLLGGLLCNNARLKRDGEDGKGWGIIGDPTEGALVVAAAKGGWLREDAEARYPRRGEIPFDSERKLMTTFHAYEGEVRSFTKGAPDVLLERCTHLHTQGGRKPLTKQDQERLMATNRALAARGERVLALTYGSHPQMPGDGGLASEEGLTLVGFFALQDPARPEAAEAVEVSRQAGIRTIMITGDHPKTATAIARDLNIFRPGDEVLTGVELNKMDEKRMQEAVERTTVYARVSPEHKLKIVKALQKKGHVVAMTGDGVNDAPALKVADIGVAMGITGTAVAKEAADMVLLDDNFATIVTAVREGRTIYDNIRKSIHYLLSCNIGEIIAIFVAILLGWGSPLTPIQLLWMNLITDGAPALSLGLEPAERGIMKRRPRPRKEGVLSGNMALGILLQGIGLGLISLISYGLALRWGRPLVVARTIAFLTLSLSQLIHSFNIRSQTQSLFSLGLGGNRSLVYAFFLSLSLQLAVVLFPFLRGILATVALPARDWFLVVGLSLFPLFFMEGWKLVVRRAQSRG